VTTQPISIWPRIGALAATMSRAVAFVVSVSGPGVTPAKQMNYSAAYALRAAGERPDVIERALQVRAVVDDYFRGRATRRVTEQAVENIRRQPWFDQVFLPIGDNLPGDPKHTKWYSQMDYDPLEVLARVKVPIALFFAETDPWVPVEESMTLVRQATRSNPDVSIRRVPKTGHYMEVGADGQVSHDYVTQLLQWLRRRARVSQ
jgi:pimeloyl-ACP methyl ester carboxylesterase